MNLVWRQEEEARAVSRSVLGRRRGENHVAVTASTH